MSEVVLRPLYVLLHKENVESPIELGFTSSLSEFMKGFACELKFTSHVRSVNFLMSGQASRVADPSHNPYARYTARALAQQ